MGTQQTVTGDDCCTVDGCMRCCMHDMGLECCLLCSSEGPHTQRPAGIALLTHLLTSLTRLASSCRCGQATSAKVQDLVHVKLAAEGPLRGCWCSALFLSFLLAVCGSSLHCMGI